MATHFESCTSLTWTFSPPVTKEDIQSHFKDANGTIAEVKLMNGFGFIEYEDAMDARDVVPGKCRYDSYTHVLD